MSTQLFLGEGTSTSCHIHPVVVMSILDHYARKSKNGERVIGTLLGLTTAEGIVEIRSSFPVPHSEGEEVSLSISRDIFTPLIISRSLAISLSLAWETQTDSYS